MPKCVSLYDQVAALEHPFKACRAEIARCLFTLTCFCRLSSEWDATVVAAIQAQLTRSASSSNFATVNSSALVNGSAIANGGGLGAAVEGLKESIVQGIQSLTVGGSTTVSAAGELSSCLELIIQTTVCVLATWYP